MYPIFSVELISFLSQSAGLMVGYSDACTVYYDNSKAFKEFLVDQGMTKGLLRRIGIRLKQKHTIVPHVN